MNTIHEHFSFPPDQSFTIRMEDFIAGEKQYIRKHSNYEIAFIDNGIGTRMINGNVEPFNGTDLVLLAGNIPHCWKYESKINHQKQIRIIVIHFFPDFLGQGFLDIPEAKSIRRLLQKAEKGIVFYGDVLIQVGFILEGMLHEKKIGRIVLFLKLMDLLSNTSSYRMLSDESHEIYYNIEKNKIDRVLHYILNNFHRPISLEEVAAIATMTANSFCRYFKLKTGRRFSDFIKELRIDHAAKLLLQGNHNISETGYLSGYNNTSNFNKHFKEIKGVSPRLFRQSRTFS